nr:MAG TPA: hypothetical protein [Caudoviricetes sp.]
MRFRAMLIMLIILMKLSISNLRQAKLKISHLILYCQSIRNILLCIC